MALRLFSAALALSLSAPTIAALADTVTDYSVLDTQNAFNAQGTAALGVAGFDTSLGTLTGATLTLEGVTGPQFEVFNFGSVAGTGTGSTSVAYAVTGAGVAGLSASASSGLQMVSVGAGPGSLASSTPVTTPFFVVSTLTDLASLISASPVTFDISQLFTTSGTTLTQGASLAYGGTASSNFELAITYTYAPASVPEPASIAILGFGLLGLCMLRRSRA